MTPSLVFELYQMKLGPGCTYPEICMVGVLACVGIRLRSYGGMVVSSKSGGGVRTPSPVPPTIRQLPVIAWLDARPSSDMNCTILGRHLAWDQCHQSRSSLGSRFQSPQQRRLLMLGNWSSTHLWHMPTCFIPSPRVARTELQSFLHLI